MLDSPASAGPHSCGDWRSPPRVKLISPATLAGAAFVLALNIFICFRMFVTEYLPHMNSIEGAYIGISRYTLEHPRDLSWFPLWYGGIPFQNSYPPLLHRLVAAAAWIFGMSPALAHHALGAAFYCLGPVALMFLAYALSGNFRLSFAASLLYSLISPSTFLMPSVRSDVGLLNARRLEALVVYGDAPHVAAMTLLLFAILAVHLAVQRRTPLAVIAAVVALASVAVTNWIGAFSLAIAALSYLLALSGGFRALRFTAGLALLAYALAAPWIPPSTILAIQKNAQFTVGYYPLGFRQLGCAGLLLVAVVGLRWLLIRYGASLCLRFSAYFLLMTAALALPDEWFHVYLMPQADRYHLEMEIAVCLVLAFGLGPHLIRAAGRYQAWLAVALLMCGAVQVRNYSKCAQAMIRPIDIRQTVEYQASRWLQQNLPGRRVFALGSIQFWMNAFSGVPQIGGGFGQGIVNPEIPVVLYGIPYTEKDGAATAMWLRLIGARAVLVNGPGSRDSYPWSWRDPDKFRGILPELWRSGGDVIYGVPQRSESLAHVVLPGDVVARFPINVTKIPLVRALNAALENPQLPIADFAWKNPHEATIAAGLHPEQVVFVQVSYHTGWRATVNGESRPIKPDGLGFMIVEPRCSGACEIHLVYDGGVEMRLAKSAQVASVLIMLGWWLAVLIHWPVGRARR